MAGELRIRSNLSRGNHSSASSKEESTACRITSSRIMTASTLRLVRKLLLTNHFLGMKSLDNFSMSALS